MNRDTMEFVVYMINKCAKKWGMSPSQVYRRLDESGCIRSYLVPFYDVLHTQSSAGVTDDIQRYLASRGYAP